MDVILLERIEKLGLMGDVVSVKPGYARNFLLPQKKALRASKENIATFEARRSELEARNLDQSKEAEAVGAKIDGMTLVVIRSAGESGQLYGSVASRDIVEGLAEVGVSVLRRQIVLERPIKALGLHTARIRLHPEVTVAITVNVAKSEDQAKLQAERGGAVTDSDVAEAAEAEREEAEIAEIAEAGISEEVAEAFFEAPETILEGEAAADETPEETPDDAAGASDDDEAKGKNA